MYKKFKEHLEEQKKDPNKIHHTQYEKHTAYGFKGGKVLARRSGSSAGGDEELEESASGKHYEAIDDVHINLENRNHAIDEYGYGPLNPKESSIDFWKQKAKLWKTSVEEAKKSRCGNCAAFNQSKEILNRIADALGPAGKIVTEKAGLGYCEMFNFKCASDRTCDAWLVNGPIK